MTPREVMTAAIEFKRPDRLAINGHGELSDCVGVWYNLIKPPQAQNDEALDQWLCRWGKTDQPNMGQVKAHPLEDIGALKNYPWPDANDPRRYDCTRQWMAESADTPQARDKYTFTSIFMILWERMHSLRGFENAMVDLMDDTPQIHEIAERILDYDITLVRNMHRVCGARIQGFGFSEDWGTQIDLHVSPDLFGRFFLPRYKRLFKVIHECGWHVHMHSCGRINKAIGMLIEAGLDVINMQQPLTNGIDEIGRQFAGRICFETLCDIQRTLPAGDEAEIDRQAAALMRTWGTPAGGMILGDYGDHAAIGASPTVKQHMVASFRRQDPWKHGW